MHLNNDFLLKFTLSSHQAYKKVLQVEANSLCFRPVHQLPRVIDPCETNSVYTSDAHFVSLLCTANLFFGPTSDLCLVYTTQK